MVSKRSTLRRGGYRPPIGRSMTRSASRDSDAEEFMALNRQGSRDGDYQERAIHDVDLEMQSMPTYHHGNETIGDVLAHPVAELSAHMRRKEEYKGTVHEWEESRQKHRPMSASARDSLFLQREPGDYVIVVHFRQLRGNQRFALDHDTTDEFSRMVGLDTKERIQFNGVHDTDGLLEFLQKTGRDFSIKTHHKPDAAGHSDTHHDSHRSHHIEHNPDHHIIRFNDNIFIEFKPKHSHFHDVASSQASRRPFFQHPEPDLSADIGEEKAASWLELFFDLFFVATLTEFTHSHAIKDWSSLGLYACWFIITWWAWIASSLYTARFDTDDVVHHIWKLIEMIAVIGMAGPADYFLNSPGYVYGYIALKVVLVIEYSIVLIVALMSHSKSRIPLAFYVGANLISIALWASSLAIVSPSLRTHLILRYLGVLTEILVNVIVRGDKTLSWAASHLAERLGLLTLIVLGENLIGLVGTVSTAGSNILIVVPNFMAVVIIFGFFFMYFEDFNKEIFLHNKYHQVWVYLHFPLHLCQVAFGIALIDTLRVYKEQLLATGTIKEEHAPAEGGTKPETGGGHGETPSGSSEGHGTASSDTNTEPAKAAHMLARRAISEIYPELDQPDYAPTIPKLQLEPASTYPYHGVGLLSLSKYAVSSVAFVALQQLSGPSSDMTAASTHHWMRRSGADAGELTEYEKVFIYKTFLITGGLILVINSFIKMLNTKISDIYGKIIIGSRILNAVVLWSMCALPFASLDAIVLISVMMGSLIIQAIVDLLD